MSYYFDYPGRPDADRRSPRERLVESFDDVVEQAMDAYVHSDAPIVEIFDHPGLRRVATIRGPRLRPRLYRERSHPAL